MYEQIMIIDFATYANMLLMLLILLGIMYGLAYILKRVKNPIFGTRANQKLKISEQIMLDNKRKLVLIECNGIEHLILLSPSGDVVVQNPAPMAKKKPAPAGKKFQAMVHSDE